MRHKNSGRKFNRSPAHRRAMFRNMAANIILHERIETTDAKAKEMRGIVERLLTFAIRLGDDLTVDEGKLKSKERERVVAARLAARRHVAKFLPAYGTKTLAGGETEEVDLLKKLFEDLAPRYLPRVKAGKAGGYTRVTKLGLRRGDNAPLAIIELTPIE